MNDLEDIRDALDGALRRLDTANGEVHALTVLLRKLELRHPEPDPPKPHTKSTRKKGTGT